MQALYISQPSKLSPEKGVTLNTKGRPRKPVALAEPLRPEDTRGSLLRELAEAAQNDRDSEVNLEQARAARDRWIKSAIAARIKPGPLCEAAGVSKKTLYDANKTEQSIYINKSNEVLLEGVKTSSAKFKAADAARGEARAERNERIARAFAAEVDTEAIGDASGVEESHIYAIAKGRQAKRRIKA